MFSDEKINNLKSDLRFRKARAFPISTIIFLLLTSAYIVCEILFNFALIHNLSVESSQKSIDKIEILGKILTGFGIGLLIIKRFVMLKSTDRDDGVTIISSFILASLFGIGLSFLIQTSIIKYVIYSGSEEDKAKSLLIIQLQNTLVPFYIEPPENAIAKFSKTEYYLASSECREQGLGLQVNNKLDKVIYSYQILSNKFNEKAYYNLVEDYQKCLIRKTILPNIPKPHLDKNAKTKSEIKLELYEKYKEIDGKYQDHVAEYNNRKTRRGLSARVIKKEWIKASKALFGSRSEVSPDLSKSQFLNHPDVISRAEFLPSVESLKSRYEKEKERVFHQSVNNVLSAYNSQKQFISGIDNEDIYFSEINEEEQKQADDAYKSIIMPQIILSFSILFLILNILSIFTFIIERIEYKFTDTRFFTKLSYVAVTVIFVWLILFPKLNNKVTVDNSGFITNTIFFYQKILIDLADKKDLTPIKKSFDIKDD